MATSNSGKNPIRRPIIVDLGKPTREKLRQLKNGMGPLVDEIEVQVQRHIDQRGDDMKGKEIIPVAVIFEKKS